MNNSKDSAENKVHDDLTSLIGLFQLFWHKKGLVVSITSIFFLLGILYSFLLSPWYEATVKIIPNMNDGPVIPSQYAGIAAMAGIELLSSGEEKMLIYPEIIKSNFVIERILNHPFKSKSYSEPVNLYEFLEINVDSTKLDYGSESYIKIEKLKKRIRKEFLKTDFDMESGVLTLKVQLPHDPILVADMANFIIGQLDDYNINFRKYKASEQIEFIKKSISETEKELENAENRLKEFQENNKDLTSPKAIIEYERLKTELEVQRTIYVELRKRLEITKIEKIKETETLNVLEEASIPFKKFKPKRSIIVLVITFIGFIFSTSVIVFNNIDIKKSLFKK